MLNKKYFLLSLIAHTSIIAFLTFSFWPKKELKGGKDSLQSYLQYETAIQATANHKTQAKQVVQNEKKMQATPNARHNQAPPQRLTPYLSRNERIKHIVSENEKEESVIIQILHEAISAVQHYPDIALELNQNGVVTIKFLLFPDGHLSNISIAKSSGFSSIDEAALSAVSTISPVTRASAFLKEAKFFTVDVIFE